MVSLVRLCELIPVLINTSNLCADIHFENLIPVIDKIQFALISFQ